MSTPSSPAPLGRQPQQVLLTGATGFIGRNLHPVLRKLGHRVISGSRSPERAQQALPSHEFRHLDVTDLASLEAAMQGCQAAFFLVHAMASGRGYEDVERRSAVAFRVAAERAGVKRIIYLGGVRPNGVPSRHLESRLRTGELLRAGRVPTLELQASMVIGGGGESWRIVRDLAARLPVMILPRWLDNASEPIAIGDVTFALAHSLELPLERSQALALPGPEALSGRDILLRTAHLLGSHPHTLRVPIVTPRLSSYWIRLVTRADQRISEELVEGLRCNLLSHDEGFWRLVPDYRRTPFDEAARVALLAEQQQLSRRSRLAERLIRLLALGSIKRVNRSSP